MNESDDVLRACWAALAADHRGRTSTAAVAAIEATIVDVLARYREPQRRYHTAAHVAAVLHHVDGLLRRVGSDTSTNSAAGAAGADSIDVDVVRAAALFHDVIYDPSSETNEADSARFAVTALGPLGWSAGRVRRVAELIGATAGHVSSPEERVVAGEAVRDSSISDMDVLLDADLAVLGAEAPVYATYASGVRSEYAHVGAEQWTTGRAAVLRALLGRAVIYRTPAMRADREHQARRNMAGELNELNRP